MSTDSTPHNSADEQVQREQLYKSYHDELITKQIANSEAYDQNILTLSAAGLGLSITFISDVVPIAEVGCRTVLIQSWFMFAGAIVTTLVSYQLSQRAIDRADKDAYAYYVQRDEKSLNRPNPWNSANKYLGYLSGLLFILAVVWTAYFVATNLPPPRMNEGALPQAARATPESRTSTLISPTAGDVSQPTKNP